MIYLNPRDVQKDRVKKEESVKEKYTVKELKDMCKENGIKGYSKMNEEELIEVLGL